MINTSERVWSLGGIGVGPVGTVGDGGTEVGVRTTVALGALVAGAATVAVGATAAGVAAGALAVGSSAVGLDAGVNMVAPGVLAPAGVPGVVVATEGAGAQALTAAIQNNSAIQPCRLTGLVMVPLLKS